MQPRQPTRRRIGLLLLAAVSGVAIRPAPGHAATRPFDRKAFETALAARKPAVVHFSASWCPTCRAQAPTVASLLTESRFRDLSVYVADYDTEKTLRSEMNVVLQSTFVVFKGGREVGRSSGLLSRDAIALLFSKAL